MKKIQIKEPNPQASAFSMLLTIWFFCLAFAVLILALAIATDQIDIKPQSQRQNVLDRHLGGFNDV